MSDVDQRSLSFRDLRVLVVVLFVLGAGAAAQLAHRDLSPPTAFAACGSSHGINCGGPKSSLLEVRHEYTSGATPVPANEKNVEPDTGETLTAQVYWATTSGGTCACTELSSTATIRVDWDQANNEWDTSCVSGCDQYAGPIFGVEVCDDDRCSQTTGTWHSWKYVLELRVDESRLTCSPTRVAYLDRVVWSTTSVDDGDRLSSDEPGCYETSACSPTSQSFSVTDTGANQAGGSFVCYQSDCSGPTVLTITYE